jgi:hypothetical protein
MSPSRHEELELDVERELLPGSLECVRFAAREWRLPACPRHATMGALQGAEQRVVTHPRAFRLGVALELDSPFGPVAETRERLLQALRSIAAARKEERFVGFGQAPWCAEIGGVEQPVALQQLEAHQ